MVRQELLARSPHVREGNFTRIAASDLRLLFELYDRRVFAGALSRALGELDGLGLGFRLSRRMTRAGGKTYFRPTPGPDRPRYEIVISSHLLFSNFQGPNRPVTVNGLRCRDRLDALLRIFEHELVHLIELLTAGMSSCRAEPFRELARGLFGHTDVTHRMEIPDQRALRTHGLRVGDRVSFVFQGIRRKGRINRITKRATVLVEDPSGAPYSDGKRYLKFYVPLQHLERAEGREEP
ncbi:MAG: SprT-like family protein [Deltaproteobacteria bacterium]|nr:SprT-like family protein [Deltaproteobacteria bacterium]